MQNLDFSVMLPFCPLLFSGLKITVFIGICSFFGATTIAVVVGSIRSSIAHNGFSKFLQGILSVYVEAFRGTPLLVQIFVVYFGLPSFGIDIEPITSAILTMSLNSGAYFSENVRAAIMAIDKGQYEAAKTLGYSPLQTNIFIILPQALRLAIPTFMNGFSTVIKETSIVSTIPIIELMRTGNQIYAINFRSFEIYITLAAIYFLLTFPFTFFAKWIERRFSKWVA